MNNAPINTNASPIELLVFFVFALLLLGGAAWLLLRASLKPDTDVPAIESGAQNQVYKDQLDALKNSLEAGAINQSEYDAGRIEIGARMLRAQKQSIASAPINQKSDKKYALSIVFIFGILSTGLYVFVGNPFYKDLPYKAREKLILGTAPENLSQDEIMVLLQNRAKEQPNDAVPHLLMGSILRGEGRPDEALRAFQAAIRRDPKNADALALMAMAMFDMNENKPDTQIENALAASLQIDAKNMNALFLKGNIEWSSGNHENAMDIWGKALLLYSAKDPRRFGLVSRIIEEISKLDKGPGDAGAAPFANANPNDTKSMIAGMIAKRAERLAQNPTDLGLRLSVARVNIMADNQAEAQKILVDGQRFAKTELEKEILNQVLSMMSEGSNK